MSQVLLNGLRLNDVGGFFDFIKLPTDDVERVEVVRGPVNFDNLVQVFSSFELRNCVAENRAEWTKLGRQTAHLGLAKWSDNDYCLVYQEFSMATKKEILHAHCFCPFCLQHINVAGAGRGVCLDLED
jgi:hypothetical protein